METKLKAVLEVALCAAGLSALAAEPADTVVYGTIRTAEATDYVKGAVAIKDGKYVYVGDEAGAAEYVRDGVTQIVDHRGKGMVMPGCTDGHSHYLNTFAMGNMKGGILFAPGDDKTNVLKKLEAAANAAKAAKKGSLCGFGWNMALLKDDRPSLKDLDGVTHDVSTVIYDASGHHAFCNSECLKRCKILSEDGKTVLIDKIDGGLLELDGEGYPTGYLNERATGYLTRMDGINPDELIDDAVAEDAIRKSQELLLSTGYTTALDAWSNNLHPSKFYEVVNRMDVSGDLKIALSMTYEVEPWQTDEALSNEIKRLDSLRVTYGTSHVRPEYLKVFMDGVVESMTGATITPYKDKSVYHSFWSTNRLADITRACNAKGLTVHTHTMGDAAVKETVDAYAQGGDGTRRNCLVHLRNVRAEDFRRIADNNIACAAGLTWHAADKHQNEYQSTFLETNYVHHAYPIKSFFDAGVKVSSHSDYPANKPCPQDPFGMMHVAVNGMVPNPTPDDYPFDTNELVTVGQAFQALTINGAWQLGLENERGSIKVGKWADFVLADRDVFECAATDIGKTKVVSTWFEGEKVYQAGSEANPWKVGKPTAENVFAYTNRTGRLVVRGGGAMKDFSAADPAPWGTTIASVDFGAQVTNVGANAFAGCSLVMLTMRGNPPALGAGNDLSGVEKVVVREDALAKFGADPSWCALASKFESTPVGYDYANVKTLAPFLHEVHYTEDYVCATDYAISANPSTAAAFACSAVRKGNFLGRNFDYVLNDVPTFVVRMDAAPGRLASVGVSQQWGFHEDGVTNGQYTTSYDLVPEMMLDGINECGVAVEDNVVHIGDCGILTGTNPDAPDLNISYVLRYVLDHATNAAHGVELIKSRNLVGNIGGHFYLHYMIADKDETYVVEVVTNAVVARHMKIMTNFNLNWNNGARCAISDANSNGWAAVDYPKPWLNEISVETISNRYAPSSAGVERFLVLRDHYETCEESMNGMAGLLRYVQYTKQAEPDADPVWISEIASGERPLAALYALYKDDGHKEDLMNMLTNMYADTRRVFADKEKYRKQNTGEWQTVHNTTYDITNRMFRIAVQEDYDNTFDIWLGGLPGSEGNPWKIGPAGSEAEVAAWTNGTGTLVVEGIGAVGSMPWAESPAGITKLIKSEGVGTVEELVGSLPDLKTVNGFTREDFSAAALGFVKAAGFSAIAVDPTTHEATLDVVIARSASLDESAEWTPVSTNTVEVPAPGEQGFFIVSPLFYVPGTDHIITGTTYGPVKPPRRTK